jgi:hypothetical protein
MEVLCIKTQSGALVPMDDEQAEKIKRIKAGSVTRTEIAQMRNARYFRKWFALAKFAYDIWSETVPQMEFRGQAVQPSFERFRKDLIVLAGYYHPVFAVNGEMRVEADSISWASMDEELFSKLYSATINAVMSKVLAGSNLTEDQVTGHVERLMRFDS